MGPMLELDYGLLVFPQKPLRCLLLNPDRANP
jgi:hypothetical protein